MGPLNGIRVIEMAGLAPVPYAGMILSDFGAEVILVDRSPAAPAGADPTRDYLARGKRSVALNLKDPGGVAALVALIKTADVLIEPFRPGVMEKLGVGPEVAAEANPRLVYGRLTGWGQDGAYSRMAGHDINYVSISGALSLVGRKGEKPLPPVNLLGDFAGGGMLCAMGVMLALIERASSGKGQVVDAAMVDGAAHLSSFIFGFRHAGLWDQPRGGNMLDTGAPFYDTYQTQDGGYMAVGAIEKQFYAALLEGLGLANEDLPHQMDRDRWEETRRRFTDTFLSKTRDQWCQIFDGTDACVSPVLELDEAPAHSHNSDRKVFGPGVNGSTMPSPAPRLSRTPGQAATEAPAPGQDTATLLKEAGLPEAEIQRLIAAGAAG